MTQPAYLYARFSTADQAKGHSLERQLSDGRAYIERQGWLYERSREITDEGLSAFHGRNREEGSALHEFETDALAGRFDNGAVLVAENIDRLTRQGWESATDLLRKLTGAGVTVALWQGGEIFPARERIDMGRVMLLIAKSELAHEESDKKSKRLKASWDKKVERAAAGDRQVRTGRFPDWLERGEDGLLKPIPHRAAVLNEIYDWYIEGKGLPWIERALNQRGEPKWSKRKDAGQVWDVTLLYKFLTTRTVLGEYEPKVRDASGKGKVSRGIVIPDFYPQVISAEKYNRVQAIRKQRQRWGGKQQFNLPNLFSGIARCAECDGKMHMVAMNKKGTTRRSKNKNGTYRSYTEKHNRSYIKCDNARRGYKCTNKLMVRYEPLEEGVLNVLLQFALKGELVKPTDAVAALRSSVAEQERLIEVKRSQLVTVTDNLMSVHSRTLAERAAALEAEIDADAERLVALRRALEAELGKAPPQEDLQELIAVQDALRSEDDETRYNARMRTHQALRSLIFAMECRPNGETAVVIGKNAELGMTFDAEGKVVDGAILSWAEVRGPEGERNWHPDEAAA